jgi:hypothetical protein
MNPDAELNYFFPIRMGAFFVYSYFLLPRLLDHGKKTVISAAIVLYLIFLAATIYWEFGSPFMWKKFLFNAALANIAGYTMYRLYRHYYPENWKQPAPKDQK